jgi:hypothetical protein
VGGEGGGTAEGGGGAGAWAAHCQAWQWPVERVLCIKVCTVVCVHWCFLLPPSNCPTAQPTLCKPLPPTPQPTLCKPLPPTPQPTPCRPAPSHSPAPSVQIRSLPPTHHHVEAVGHKVLHRPQQPRHGDGAVVGDVGVALALHTGLVGGVAVVVGAGLGVRVRTGKQANVPSAGVACASKHRLRACMPSCADLGAGIAVARSWIR